MISILIASITTSTSLTLLDWIVTLFAGLLVLLTGWYFSYMAMKFGEDPKKSLERKFREEVESRKHDQVYNRKNKC